MMHRFYQILLLLSMPLLFSCSTTTNSAIATVGQVAFGNNDVVMNKESVKNIPYASAYIKMGDNPQAFVVLAYTDKDENLSWVSADHSMFITRNGRLVKTVGLENDLVSISSVAKDPLAELNARNNFTWQFLAEWEKNYVSGYHMLSRLQKIETTTVDILGEPRKTELFEEVITIEHSGCSWKNYYWMDSKTGLVVKSKQQLGPNLPVIEMTILKPYAS